MITAAQLRDILAHHVLTHGDGPVQAFSPAGLVAHETLDVQECELEQDETGRWLATLRLGGDER